MKRGERGGSGNAERNGEELRREEDKGGGGGGGGRKYEEKRRRKEGLTSAGFVAFGIKMSCGFDRLCSLACPLSCCANLYMYMYLFIFLFIFNEEGAE